jgi:Bifunctional DNA primase/polymerase, N-terminal
MSTASPNGFPTEPRQAAEVYLGKGLSPIPMPPRSKDPGYAGWPVLRLTPDDLDVRFPTGEPHNVGVLNGSPSGNALDVDLDCPEARSTAETLLPSTGWVFGHPSNPRSHRIYKTDRALDSAKMEFTDLAGKVLVELRGSGGLTVYPPSTHRETGEPITWHEFTTIGEMLLGDLQNAVAAVAASALLARYWPETGTRDKAAMALSGGLTRAGWSAEQVSRFVEAVAEAAGDEEARMRAGKAAPAARKQEDGKKTTGWPTLARLVGDGEAVVRQVREWLGIATAAESAESIIVDPPPWPDPPGEEAFHGLAGEIVRTIEPASEADPTALLVQSLVCFGNVIGRGAYFEVEADRHHGNEFVVLVGKTAKARKGTSWGQIYRLFREADEEWAAGCVASGASSGEGIIWAVRDPISKQEKIKEAGEVRYEAVVVDPGVADKRLLVYEAEFANVLKQTERQGNNLSAILRNAWDGRDLRSLTKNSPARATGAHIALVGHITADELRRYLTQTEMANGYGNRHLWICADRSKRLPEGGKVNPEAWGGLRNSLAQALVLARSAGEVRRDEEARSLWIQMYDQLSEGRPGMAGSLLARAEAHVMRLAMIYALMDGTAVIGAEHLLAALALWDYVERSVYFVFGDALGDPLADDLLRLLRTCPGGLTRNELMNHLGRNQSSDRIGRSLGLLLQHELARCERQDTGGRPAERWFAVARGRQG